MNLAGRLSNQILWNYKGRSLRSFPQHISIYHQPTWICVDAKTRLKYYNHWDSQVF